MRQILFAMILASVSSVQAQAPTHVEQPIAPCPFRNDPPWAYARPVTAASGLPAPTLVLAQPLTIALTDAAKVHFAVPLTKPAVPGDSGGLLALHAPIAGTYRIELSAKAWVDVVKDRKVLVSVGHAHGAPCSGIAKSVDFDLPPGDYIVQISAAASNVINLAVDSRLQAR